MKPKIFCAMSDIKLDERGLKICVLS